MKTNNINFVKPVLFFICFLLCSLPLFAQDGWNGLIPLTSTRKDAEKLLGRPDNYLLGGGRYTTDNEIVYIWYSTGTCPTDDQTGYKVAKNILTSIMWTPKKTLLLTELKWDLTEFKKSVSERNNGRAYYLKNDETVQIEVFQNEDLTEKIVSIDYMPGTAGKKLLCTE